MPSAEFTAKLVYPNEDKPNGKIIATDGSNYHVPRALMSKVAVGNTYKASFRENTFNGKVNKFVDSLDVLGEGGGASAPPSNASSPSTSRNQPAARYQDDMATSERIMVCGWR